MARRFRIRDLGFRLVNRVSVLFQTISCDRSGRSFLFQLALLLMPDVTLMKPAAFSDDGHVDQNLQDLQLLTGLPPARHDPGQRHGALKKKAIPWLRDQNHPKAADEWTAVRVANAWGIASVQAGRLYPFNTFRSASASGMMLWPVFCCDLSADPSCGRER